jgi:hypothetical protein
LTSCIEYILDLGIGHDAVASSHVGRESEGVYNLESGSPVNCRSTPIRNTSVFYNTTNQTTTNTPIMSDSKDIPVVADKELASGVDAQAADRAAEESEKTGKIPQSKSPCPSYPQRARLTTLPS